MKRDPGLHKYETANFKSISTRSFSLHRVCASSYAFKKVIKMGQYSLYHKLVVSAPHHHKADNIRMDLCSSIGIRQRREVPISIVICWNKIS